MFDIIGDIHGHAAKLDALLRKLGYVRRLGTWVPPQGRQAIFLGDLIDRGPEQLKVIDTVRRMIDAGHARSIMGNHEFNAIGYITERRDAPGRYLRPHTSSKTEQHAEFLRQVVEGSVKHFELIAWFKTLPPALDLGGIRVVHAWWHQPFVDLIARELGSDPMNDDFLHIAYDNSSPAYAAMDGLTKGQEIGLPSGYSFADHAGVERRKVRTRWWRENVRCYRDVAIVPDGQEHAIPPDLLPDAYIHANSSIVPVFVGHYWFSGVPVVQTLKVACLDWSAAKDGPLVAYRWDGEAELSNAKFVASWASSS